MKRHSIIVRLNPSDTKLPELVRAGSAITKLRFVDGNQRLGYGIGSIIGQLVTNGLYPSETAIDLAILAAAITAADTRISRKDNSQDSWTREIDLYIPVADKEKWGNSKCTLERMLRFLTGDIWQIHFRVRQKGIKNLIERPARLPVNEGESVCLFSGGLDSFIGAIDLLHDNANTIFISHYGDTSTANQLNCIKQLEKACGNLSQRHFRANVSFNKNDMPGEGEDTTRGRSFLFFALACLAADALEGNTTIYIPENGLISLNVPLDPLRLGAWSTRTTHPFYMAQWQKLLNDLGINATLENPYRFQTKGEMLSQCSNQSLLKSNIAATISCSSYSKGRWQGKSPEHCGYCTPCLIRRASVQYAFRTDPTTYSIPDLKASPLAADRAESRDVRSFQMMSSRLSKNPNLAKILVLKPGPLTDYSENDIENYAKVFSRGISEVGAMVNSVVIKAC